MLFRSQKVTASLRAAMDRKGVKPAVADKIVQAVGSFALYGFPESHAISFALLAYASAWLKVHRAPEFFCALLNNQPMGFYAPDTLVKDARRRGVRVRPVCVAASAWDTLIEPDGSLRLGLRQVEGLRREHAQAMLAARAEKVFASIDDFKIRTRFTKPELRSLAEIGALNSLASHRRAALWQTEATVREDELFSPRASEDHAASAVANPAPQFAAEKNLSPLAPMTALERLQADYSGLGLTTGSHPMAFVRDRLRDAWRAAELPSARNGTLIRVAGLVICRQRPGTAKGICFVSIEDETGIANAIVDRKSTRLNSSH